MVPLSSFSVGHLLWSSCSTLKRNFISETPLEKTKFSFANGYALEIASG